MKLSTPKKKAKQEAIEEFISGAEQPKNSTQQENKKPRKKENDMLPWEDPYLRDDVTKLFNLRLSEKHYAMLKYLAEHQKKESMHSICLDVLEPMLERESVALAKKREQGG